MIHEITIQKQYILIGPYKIFCAGVKKGVKRLKNIENKKDDITSKMDIIKEIERRDMVKKEGKVKGSSCT